MQALTRNRKANGNDLPPMPESRADESGMSRLPLPVMDAQPRPWDVFARIPNSAVYAKPTQEARPMRTDDPSQTQSGQVQLGQSAPQSAERSVAQDTLVDGETPPMDAEAAPVHAEAAPVHAEAIAADEAPAADGLANDDAGTLAPADDDVEPEPLPLAISRDGDLEEVPTRITPPGEMNTLRAQSRRSVPPPPPSETGSWPVQPDEQGNEDITNQFVVHRPVPGQQVSGVETAVQALREVYATCSEALAAAPRVPLIATFAVSVSAAAWLAARPPTPAEAAQGSGPEATAREVETAGKATVTQLKVDSTPVIRTVTKDGETRLEFAPLHFAPPAAAHVPEAAAEAQGEALPATAAETAELDEAAERARNERRWKRAMNRAQQAMNSGDYRKAAWTFERAAQYKPEDPESYTGLGDALLGVMQPRRAKKAYQKALDIDPKHSAAIAGKRRAAKLGKASKPADAPEPY